ncbi:hypothetical protein DFR30_1106 [Thiogranum longum]|uniref:Uncharacterized protein n=1 Tax=Thiogranum longum TaxID=1537524 RepID=A0A4R1H7Q2_9GAMM|nr:hypothetical protein [Thiogranum longum]TCK17854.1 hypothetical protein DFR30_1106 [Thiogranum longum]
MNRLSKQTDMRAAKVIAGPASAIAVKAGVQIPIVSNLHGRQDSSDYRARLIL